jgi:hypothetical protein
MKNTRKTGTCCVKYGIAKIICYHLQNAIFIFAGRPKHKAH